MQVYIVRECASDSEPANFNYTYIACKYTLIVRECDYAYTFCTCTSLLYTRTQHIIPGYNIIRSTYMYVCIE